MRPFLLIPHIRIHNANAMSSPYSIGFPAMTAWLGAVHALQRKLQQLPDFENLCLSKVGISCHQLEVQTHRNKGDFVSSIIGTGNPLDKDGSRPSFIEEARCHVTVSLLIEMSESDPEWEESLPIAIAPMLRQMKMAAGDVLSFREPQVLYLEEGNASKLKKLTQRLMLGHVLVERRQLLQDYVATNPEQDLKLLNFYWNINIISTCIIVNFINQKIQRFTSLPRKIMWINDKKLGLTKQGG